MVPADSYKVSRAPYYLGYSWGSEDFVYRTVTVSGGPFCRPLRLSSSHPVRESRNPFMTCVIKVWAVPLSLAATDGITGLFSFLPGNKMFQFPDLPRAALFIPRPSPDIYSGGVAPFGYPRIVVCNDSPWHFAVCCVLHRLLAPRYPPCALSSLTNI